MLKRSFWFGLLICSSFAQVAYPRMHTAICRAQRDKEVISKKNKLTLGELLFELDAAQNEQKMNEVERLCKVIAKEYPNSDAAAESYFLRGLLYESDRKFNSAIDMFTKIVKQYPDSLWFSYSVEKCFLIAEQLQNGIRPKYFGVIPGFKDYNSAVQNYELVVRYAPYSRYAPHALIEIANLHVKMKNYDQAVEALDRIIDLYPDSVEVAEAYLKTAEIYAKMVKSEEHNQGGALAARRYYKEFIDIFPQHEHVEFARQKILDLDNSVVESKISLGDFYFNARYNECAAKKMYQMAIDFAPYVSAADTARQRITDIDNGMLPKSTPIDFLFPKYHPTSDKCDTK